MSPLDRYVDRAVRTAQRRGVRIALTGYLILFAGIVGERYISSSESAASRNAIVQSGTAVAVDGCNGRFEDRTELRNILVAIRAIAVERRAEPGLTTREKAELDFAESFYADRLRKLRLPDCRKSLTVLNDDPDAKVRIPKPKHP